MTPLATASCRRRHIHRPYSALANRKRELLRETLARGQPVYLAGIGVGGVHNSGVALVEIDPVAGPRIVCNNEEERFSGRKHSNLYPEAALQALAGMMEARGVAPRQVAAWLGTFDYALASAAGLGAFVEEFPASLGLREQDPDTGVNLARLADGLRAPRRLAELFGEARPIPVVGMRHHDNHAAFSYMVSPFALEAEPTMTVVVDGAGDCASISLYLGAGGSLWPVRDNGSFFDSLGGFYSVVSSTQGGWTMLSSEGRYMGAAAYGDMNRDTNPYYAGLRDIFRLEPDGLVRLNRALANWHSAIYRAPYTPRLAEILGPPIPRERLWNPDAVLKVEDIRHEPHNRDRVDKAAATQMVFEDGLFHVVDAFIRATAADRLVLSGGSALNAVANMRLLERFDEDYYQRSFGRQTRLRLWVPPTPGDAGVTLGAAYAFAMSAGVSPGPALQHAFYCGHGLTGREWRQALSGAGDVAWLSLAEGHAGPRVEPIAELMASITADGGVIGVVQGAAETGPRALGHRSILADACNPQVRELINARVKHREKIRPLAPMATLAAAQALFELSDGAAADGYNAYNYMVITVRAKPEARRLVPAVVHADGTARIQVVRAETDPVAHAYLKAVGRRSGAEVAVNTSFNVGAPIAQTPAQALDTLRRAKGMDGVFLFADDGPVFLAWMRPRDGQTARAPQWVDRWRAERLALGPAESPLAV